MLPTLSADIANGSLMSSMLQFRKDPQLVGAKGRGGRIALVLNIAPEPSGAAAFSTTLE